MTPEELTLIKQRADADDPVAMFEYAKAIRFLDVKESDKFIVLAAQLGNADAIECLGDKYMEEGNYAEAVSCFKQGARAGKLDCSVKLAALRLSDEESDSLRELEDLAEMGVRSACLALHEYYKAKGNRKQAAYWQSLIK